MKIERNKYLIYKDFLLFFWVSVPRGIEEHSNQSEGRLPRRRRTATVRRFCLRIAQGLTFCGVGGGRVEGSEYDWRNQVAQQRDDAPAGDRAGFGIDVDDCVDFLADYLDVVIVALEARYAADRDAGVFRAGRGE